MSSFHDVQAGRLQYWPCRCYQKTNSLKDQETA